ncbi:breast cancer metastasis-suppressor 1-like protein-A [Varroa jacobsoni]|uniref:Breast cancer metastasis-suppressor 1-like protein n=1 Tax=Varroa destructor TaxID=109461 RepID=A0A7M7MHC6_VARDE|nr:breast cancer metastasis-suppressor 1-like protein-A [Varroa destructor]XP_022700314.1 breast cancer metastasis-suppressor 1-like protein-A [Varroa jacobsoni]
MSRRTAVKEDSDQEMDEHSSDNEDTDTSSASDDDSSSEMDEVDFERRRLDCVDDMIHLERQFLILKEQLYTERIRLIERKLAEIRSGQADEYLVPLAELREGLSTRIEVAKVHLGLRTQSIRSRFEAETLAAKQTYENDVNNLKDEMINEIREKIRQMEEERTQPASYIMADFCNMHKGNKGRSRKADPNDPERRKKPVTVSGPYIVYMLRENEIMEDWATIRKALRGTRWAEHGDSNGDRGTLYT